MPNEDLHQNLESDQRLVERAQGDANAFGEIFDAHDDRILNYLVRRCGDVAVAQDLASEVFLKALRGIHKYSWRGLPIQAWLYAIAANELKMYYRRHKLVMSLDEMIESAGFEVASEGDLAEELEDARAQLEREQKFARVQTLIKYLSPNYQEAIVLR